MLKAQPAEHWSSGILRKCQSVQDRLAAANSTIKASEESVQVEDKKIADLEDQESEIQERARSLDSHVKKRTRCRSSSSLSGNKHENTSEREQSWPRQRREECRKSSRWKSRTIDPRDGLPKVRTPTKWTRSKNERIDQERRLFERRFEAAAAGTASAAGGVPEQFTEYLIRRKKVKRRRSGKTVSLFMLHGSPHRTLVEVL